MSVAGWRVPGPTSHRRIRPSPIRRGARREDFAGGRKLTPSERQFLGIDKYMLRQP